MIGGLVALASDTGSGNNDALENLTALRLVRLLRLIKLLRLLRSSRIIERWESSLSLKFATTSLGKLALSLLFACHLFACFWNIVSTYTDVGYANWRIGYGIEDRHWSEVYLSAFYWSTMTLTTIGYVQTYIFL